MPEGYHCRKQVSDCSFKASETLLGIETFRENYEQSILSSFKASETLLGIETQLLATHKL